MLDPLVPQLAVMLAAVAMVSLGRAVHLLDLSRPPRRCPSCGRSGRGSAGCSCT